jgi:aromatic-L-amino-acid decarboxylase
MTLLERLNDGGEVFLTHTTVRGQVVLRIAVGAPATTRAHVERVWALLCEAHDWLAADFAAAAAERAAEAAQAAETVRLAQAERSAEREAARQAEPDVQPTGVHEEPQPAGA